MAAPTLVQTTTSGSTGASSAGSVTVSTTATLGSNTTTGNVLVITIQAKSNILNGNRGILPTSGNYNATLNSSYTNIGSSSNPQGGFDCVSAHNKTSTSIYMQTWCFYATVSSGAAFSETFDFTSDHTGSFGIVPHFSVTVEEWSGLDSVVAGTGDIEDNVQDTFGFSQTGVSFANDDILAMHHYCDNDPDDDSVITINASASGVTKSNSTSISGNIRRESYRKTVSAGSTFSITYDDDAGSNGGNLTKHVQVIKLVAPTSTTYANTAEIINTAHVQCSRDIEYQSSITRDHTVILTIYKGNDSTEGDVNGFSGGVWHSKSAYSDDATKTLVNYHYTDANFGGSSAVPQTLYVANNDIIQAPQIDSADCNLALDFSTAGFATPSTGTVTQISDLIDLTAITDITSGKFINQSNTLGDWNALRHNTASGKVGLPAALQTTLSKSTEATIFMMFGSMPASGSVYLFGEHDATNTTGDDPKFYILTNSASQLNAQEGTVFATTTGYEDYQVRTLRWEKTSVIERVNGTQVVSTGTVGSNASLTIESLFQVLTDENTFSSATGAELMEIYIVDHAMETNAIEMMEGYFYQKYNLSSQSYSEQAWPTSGHVINESTPFTLYEHTPNSIVSKFVLTGTGDYTNESISGPIIVTIGKSPVGSLSTVTLRFE